MSDPLSPVVAIIDYGAGNSRSVANALTRLEVRHFITANPEELRTADKLILPGVGEARSAMASLDRNDLIAFLRETTKPFLGICLGMQILYDHSTERATDCLGILTGRIDRFDDAISKVPHMGWNSTQLQQDVPLFSGCSREDFFYYVHSYCAPLTDATVAVCDYTVRFAAAVRQHNHYGVQFHPEKSASQGLRVLHNFVTRC